MQLLLLSGVRLLAVVSDVFYLITVECICYAIHKLELRAQFEVWQIEIASQSPVPGILLISSV